MDQDWKPVVLTKSKPVKVVHHQKAESADGDINIVKKQVQAESLQMLCKRRTELSLKQKQADTKCAFPVNTFRDIENRTAIPSEKQQNVIQRVFGVQLKILKC